MTKTEKIMAMLEGKAHEKFFAEVQGGTAKDTDYQDYWSDITFDEVIKAAHEKGELDALYHKLAGDGDGMYLIESDNKWVVYRQERGQKYEPIEFETKEGAIDKVVEFVAASFGIFKPE